MSRFVALSVACGVMIAGVIDPAPGADTPADGICPSATSRLGALEDADRTHQPKEIEKAARAVVDAYFACYNGQKFNGRLNPSLQQEWMNYDETRMAQYLVLVGRAQLLQGKTSECGVTWHEARNHALDVIEWIPFGQTIRGPVRGPGSAERTTDRRRSRWYDIALAARDAADDELGRLQFVGPVPERTP
jgi:hypothetical protein